MSQSLLFVSPDLEKQNEFIERLISNLSIDSSGGDFLKIMPQDEKASITIKQIRELIVWLATKPYKGINKMVVIQPAEAMTHQAQNSLLKALEEPNPSNTILLLSKNKRNLLSTIISRCVVEEENKYREQFTENNFVQLNAVDRLLHIGKFLTEKDKAKQKLEIEMFIGGVLLQQQRQLQRSETRKSILANIALLNKAKRQLETNTSKKLLLENLALNLRNA